MSSKIKGLRRVGIVGLSTVVAASMMSFSAVSAQAAWATSGGEIGLVDTDTTTGATPALAAANGTQGATQVVPGVNGQALGDVRLLLPNTFVNGDTIDLTIFDRTATNGSEGQINADAAHKLGFTGVPTVAVNATPFAASTDVALSTLKTHIGPLSSSPGNTEGTTANGNAATPYVVTPAVVGPPAVPATVKPTTPPVFTTSVIQSSRANGLATDIIRLTINGVQASGDANADWVVTLSGLKADLGAAVSPGELRVVPFAYNGTPTATSSNPSRMFAGNLADQDGNPNTFDPAIKTYTVPAYVAPVNFTVGAPNNVVADNTAQTVGDITIGETNNFSLQNGTYKVTVVGATVVNDVASPIAVTATGLATGETVVKAGTDTQVWFTVAGASNTSKISVKLSGLLLTAGAKGLITYTLTGGSIDGIGQTPTTAGFLVNAGTSTAIGDAAPNGVAADSAFVSPAVVGPPAVPAGSINQTDIEAPTFVVDAIATPIAFRIGGIDRYQTAEKIALTRGENPVVVLASGEKFPDALSSGYLAGQFGASILLTAQNSLPASTVEGMRLLGTKTVYLIGGTNAISAGVEAQLLATSQYQPGGTVTIGQGKLQVIRLGGADRYATNQIVNLRAAAVSTNANPVGRTSITFGQASKLTALVATGENFADAMSGGPATAGPVARIGSADGREGLPLILTPSGSLSPSASSQFTSLGITQAVILGGTNAVSASVETSIKALNAATFRLAGANRAETATKIADFEFAPQTPTATSTGGLGFTGNHAYLARSDVFADALAGAPLAGFQLTPILLTAPTTLSPETATWLKANAGHMNFVTALGLGVAVSSAVLDAANLAITG